jgi:hypothetical protein
MKVTADREIRRRIQRENVCARRPPMSRSRFSPTRSSRDIDMLGYIDPCFGLIAVYLVLVGLTIGSLRLLRKVLTRGSVAVIQMEATTFLEMADGRLEFRPRRLRTYTLVAVFALAAIGVIWLLIGLIIQKNPAARSAADTARGVLLMLISLGIILGALSQLIGPLRSPMIRIDGRAGTIVIRRGTTEEHIAASRVTGVGFDGAPPPGLQSLDAMFRSVRLEVYLAQEIASKVEAALRPAMSDSLRPG